MPRFDVGLNTNDLQALIDRLNAYRDSLEDRAERLRQLFAERVAWRAASGFSTALTSDIFVGASPPPSNVSVSVTDDGDVTLVIADGEEAVFIEFGAGVYYNGAAGSSPHAWGASNGFLIGQYGKGQGKKNVWALPGSTHDMPILTHGTPAAMPMYHGVQDALVVLTDLARSVFAI